VAAEEEKLMRRIISALVLIAAVLAVALGAVACGGGDEESTPAPPPADTSAAPAAPPEPPADTAPAVDGGGIEFTGSLEADAPVGYDEPDPGEYTHGFLNPLQGNEFLNTLGRAMRLETERLGGTLVELDAKLDVDTQVSQFEQLIAREVDGIFVFPLDPASVQPALERAKAAGIRVITIDLNFESTTEIGDYDSQIWQRRDEAAYLGAREMASRVEPGSSLGTIDLIVKVPSIVYSIQQGKYWAEQFGLAVAGNASNPSDDIAGGEKAMTELLGNFPDIAGVIGYNDPSAIGAGAAARAQGKEGLVFGGQNGGSDAYEAIRAGRLSYTAKLDPPSMGKFAAWGLFNLLQGNEIPPTVKAEAPVIVTEENVDSEPTWDDHLQEEYGKTE
jgi:ribose transport system substrate-binding protein